MFSFQPCDELVFATPTTSQEYKIPESHLVMDHSSLSESNLISFSATHIDEKQATDPRSSRRKQADQSRYGFSDRRVEHRDIERRRRQQMSKLFNSLSALLPNKERRSSSVCGKMEEATSYIKQMEKNIGELQSRRDELNNKLNFPSSQITNVEKSLHSIVAIHEVMDGLEILISSKSPVFELTRVLSELVERELDVVSCVSTTTTGGGYIHKLEIKAWDMMSLDVSELINWPMLSSTTGANEYKFQVSQSLIFYIFLAA